MAFSDEDIKENGPNEIPISWDYRSKAKRGAGASTRSDDRNNKALILKARSRRKPAPVKILKEKKECPTNQK